MQPYRQMAVFATVVENQGFTKAARKLGIAVSAVSRMVTELEEHVGVSLLSRTTRRLALTEPGATYFESCRRMVAEADGAGAALVGGDLEPTGCLRLTVAIGLARHVMPVLAELSNEHPRLEFDVHLEDRYADLVAEDLDLAVRGGPLQDSSLIARPLADVVYVVCAAPAYLQRKGLPRKPSDLVNHEWIHHEQGPRQVSGRHGGRAFHVRIRGRLRANSGPAVIELLRAGAGLALAPLWEVADDLRSRKLKVVLPQCEFKRSRVHCVSPPGRERLPKVRTASNRLVERLSREKWDRIDPRWIAGRP